MSTPNISAIMADPRAAAQNYIANVYEVPLPDKSKLEVTKAFIAGCSHTMLLVGLAEQLPEDARETILREMIDGLEAFVTQHMKREE